MRRRTTVPAYPSEAGHVFLGFILLAGRMCITNNVTLVHLFLITYLVRRLVRGFRSCVGEKSDMSATANDSHLEWRYNISGSAFRNHQLVGIAVSVTEQTE
jgi:hypothetical protein